MTTSQPSTATTGADESISSPQVSPASLGAQPESDVAQPTSATSGPSLLGCLAKYDRATRSWRTAQSLLFTPTSGECSETLPKSGSMRNGVVWPRETLEHPTAESASGYWPTAKVATGDYQYAGGDHSKPILNLEGAAKAWPTPSANEFQDLNSENLLARRARCKETAKNGNGFGLTTAQAASLWATPNAHDARREMPDTYSTQHGNLSRDTAKWSTPCARDSKDQGSPAEFNRHSLALGPQALLATGPPSQSISGPRRLNPSFVEWLMGWPLGATASEPLAMAGFLAWRRVHSGSCLPEPKV